MEICGIKYRLRLCAIRAAEVWLFELELLRTGPKFSSKFSEMPEPNFF